MDEEDWFSLIGTRTRVESHNVFRSSADLVACANCGEESAVGRRVVRYGVTVRGDFENSRWRVKSLPKKDYEKIRTQLCIARFMQEWLYVAMATARYVLRGKITSADPAATGSMIELLVWLDHEANKTRSDMLEVVKAQYEREARKHGWQIAWHIPFVASPACAVQPNQLLFAFFGVRVFELTTSEAINPVSA